MSEALWHVTLDGVPLEGRYDHAQVQALIGEYPGRILLVWKEGMEGWVDPRRLPDFEADASPPHPSRTTASQMKPIPVPTAGFFQALMDFRFEQFITPRSMGILYGLVMVFVGIVLLSMVYFEIASVINGARFHMGGLVFRGLLVLLLAPLVALLLVSVPGFFRIGPCPAQDQRPYGPDGGPDEMTGPRTRVLAPPSRA